MEVLDAGDVGVTQPLQLGHRTLIELPLPIDDEYIHTLPVRDLDVLLSFSLIFRYGQMMTRCFLASSEMWEIQVFVS